mgnify:CR=1 FL=1
MLERVLKTISRYNMIQPGQRIGVAVSGGADSVCLLHLLLELAPRWELALGVLHVDHQLRAEESRQDAEFVRELAARFGLPFHGHRADVRRLAEERGDNLEQAARQVRLEFFLGLIRQGVVDRVALGHTRSDQAETVLFRFLRGSGTAGLAGIRPVTPEGLVRPLIEIGRAEVEQYLGERGIAWRLDATNLDRRLARNRIRHDLLPALTREWNPALSETLAQTARLSQDEEEYWDREVDRLAAAHLVLRPPAVILDAAALAGLPRAAARRLVRRAIKCARGDLRRIEFAHVEQILELASTLEGHGQLHIPGVEVLRSFDQLRLAPPEPADYRFALSAPGRYPIPGASSSISLELQEVTESTPKPGYNTEGSGLDWGRLTGALELRNWQPGDQYHPVGRRTETRIKELFQRARIPLWERRKWPIITSGGVIVWSRQFGASAGYAATAASRRVLMVHEQERA